jgi:hypothetical protein
MGREEVYAGFKRENLRKGDHLKDRGLDGRIILKLILEKWHGGINWIDLTQGMRYGWLF